MWVRVWTNCTWTQTRTSTTRVLVWRLAPVLELLSNSDNFRGQQECVAPLVKVVLPGDTCRGKVCNGAWRHTSPVRRSEKHVAPSNSWVVSGDIGEAKVFCLFWCACSTRRWWFFEGQLAGVPWVVAQNVSLELSLGMADEHKELLSCGSGWRVLPVWVCALWHVRMGPVRLPFSILSWRVW